MCNAVETWWCHCVMLHAACWRAMLHVPGTRICFIGVRRKLRSASQLLVQLCSSRGACTKSSR